jgi:hypothetical protein
MLRVDSEHRPHARPPDAVSHSTIMQHCDAVLQHYDAVLHSTIIYDAVLQHYDAVLHSTIGFRV